MLLELQVKNITGLRRSKNRARSHSIALALAGAFVLSTGCVNGGSAGSGGGSNAKPLDGSAYQYKGRSDPLAAQSGAERAGSLAERFARIQGRQ